MLELLASHAATRGVRLIDGVPEARIFFDRLGGEPRNADLALREEGADGPVAVTVEAKADEPFGARHEANARDLDLFVQRLSAGDVERVEEGQIVGHCCG
jgi:hypothetical protein